MTTPDDLGLDERIVIARVAAGTSTRLRRGARDYGALALSDYPRDALAEAREEMLDGAVYLEIALVQRDEERRAHAAEVARMQTEIDRLSALLAATHIVDDGSC